MPAGGRAGHGLPGRQAVAPRPAPVRGPPEGLPELLRLPRADPGDSAGHRLDRARRPVAGGAAGPHRPVPPVAIGLGPMRLLTTVPTSRFYVSRPPGPRAGRNRSK